MHAAVPGSCCAWLLLVQGSLQPHAAPGAATLSGFSHTRSPAGGAIRVPGHPAGLWRERRVQLRVCPGHRAVRCAALAIGAATSPAEQQAPRSTCCGSAGPPSAARCPTASSFPAAALPPAGRRASKLVSLVASCFGATYVRLWGQHLPGTPLAATPMFDARAVLYPSEQTLRDYLSWRQADTHINNLVQRGGVGCGQGFRAAPAAAAENVGRPGGGRGRVPACRLAPLLPCLPRPLPSPSLCFPPAPTRPQYNTCFWALVKSGKSTTEAHAQLRVGRAGGGTVSGCGLPGPTCSPPAPRLRRRSPSRAAN